LSENGYLEFVGSHNPIIANPGAVLKLVRLVLKLGADPNAIDECGLAPLHRLAAMKECLPDVLPVFQALVDAGGHLDMANFDGDTVLDVVKQSLQHIKDSSEVEDYSPPPYYASLLKKVFPLSCLCARVIREHGIPFDGGRLPLRLQEFISRHRPTEGDGLLKNNCNRFTYRVCNFLLFFYCLNSLRQKRRASYLRLPHGLLKLISTFPLCLVTTQTD
jgi:hypothetical protein